MRAIRWSLLVLVLGLSMNDPGRAQHNASPAAPSAPKAIDARAWPHSFDVDGVHLVLHHPQLESWDGNQLKGRLAVAVKTGTQVGSDGKSHDVMEYGVAWFSARTATNKAEREVTLSNIAIEKVSFPTATAQQARYQTLLQSIVARGTQVANLDTLEASLAIRQAQVKSVAVRNDPPQIIFSFTPALLVLIDGTPALRSTGKGGVSRIVNTRSLMLQENGQYHLLIAGRWLKSSALDGPWNLEKSPPSAVLQAAAQAENAKQVDTLDHPSDALKQTLASGKLPDIVVRTQPAELISIDGDPQFEAITGTQLAYVTNTSADVFVDQTQDLSWYVLISGRWFTAPSTNGPWRYVAGKDMPGDFAKIPSDSPKSAVLASVPGTPEARESLIANSIPQTASVNVRSTQLHLSYDGPAQFKPIDGTSLSYAWNTPVPVIRVTEGSYFAVQNGVWFSASTANGPWSVARDVPAVIYSIPPNSPLHYVTYVYVYGQYGDQVEVGYSPGYYGTVSSDGVVVYGTGYACNSWVGNVWYGCPATYGFDVSFGWTPWAGWAFGFGWGAAWASAWYGPWWGPWGYWGGGFYPGYWGGAISAASVYGRWGNSVVAGRGAAWADPWTGNYGRAGRGGYYNTATGGRGYGYAGRNTNAYTGVTSGQAGGIRYNPQTGRVVAGQGGAAVNPYTGNAVAGGQRTVVNTNTGRVTQQGGVAGRTNEGAGAAGAFNTQGAGGDARGAGYANYNRDTGQVNRGGVVDVDDHVYAGHDGNVYRYNPGEGWQKAGGNGDFNHVAAPDSAETEHDRMARDRGAQGQSINRSPAGQSFDRGNYDNHFHGQMGGFRPSFGGGHFGGGRMGGRGR